MENLFIAVSLLMGVIAFTAVVTVIHDLACWVRKRKQQLPPDWWH